MTEERLAIDTPDGHKIYCVVNRPEKKKNNKAILYIHGLTGNALDYAATRMALTFPKKGYDVIRANLYWWRPGARRLVDSTIKVHGKDIDTLVKYFSKQYKKLYGVGHSYGGPSLMMSNINKFAAVTLWDPSFTPSTTIERKDFKKLGKYYFDPISSGLVVSDAFLKEAEAFDRDFAISLSKKCKTPLKVIYGDRNSFWLKVGESFHTHARGPTAEHAIQGSQHCFYEEGATAPLLRYTKQWFDKF